MWTSLAAAVIARSDSDEAIQTIDAEKVWIASLALALTKERGRVLARLGRVGKGAKRHTHRLFVCVDEMVGTSLRSFAHPTLKYTNR